MALSEDRQNIIARKLRSIQNEFENVYSKLDFISHNLKNSEILRIANISVIPSSENDILNIRVKIDSMLGELNKSLISINDSVKKIKKEVDVF